MMAINEEEPEKLLLWRFFQYLKTEGFYISIGEYLSIYDTIGKIKPSTSPFEDLKYILCPLLVKNQEHQQKFYSAFDKYFNLPQATPSQVELPLKEVYSESHKEKKKEKGRINLKMLKIGISVFMAFISLGYFYYTSIRPILPTSKPPVNTEEQQIQLAFEDILSRPELNIDSLTILKNDIQISYNHFKEGKVGESMTAFLSSAYWTYYLASGAPTLYEKCRNLEGKLDDYNYSFDPTNVSSFDFLTLFDVRVFLMLLIVVCFILYEYYIHQNQTFMAQLAKGRKPPYVWQFNLSKVPKIKWDSKIYQASHLLRKRIVGDELDFDIHKTIKNTLNHGGVLELAYKSRLKPSEYLILIDRSSVQSHLSNFFSFLAKELSENDIHIEQFFYQGDMKVFWEVDGMEKSYRLNDLIRLYPKHRVIIFGKAHEIIDFTKGKVNTYFNEMEVWPDKAVLTPRPSADWDYKEVALSEFFTVLPSNSLGLLELIDHFEQIKSSQLGAWKYDFTEQQIVLPSNADRGIANLCRQLPPQVFKWLSMCAVYPQLFWDLTLYIGEAMFLEKSLVTQEHLQMLLKISWFEEGFIPKDYRQKLLETLGQDEIDEVRKKIVVQMRKYPPKLNTYAHDEYKLNLLVNELLIKDLPEIRKKDIRKEINELKDQNDLSYYTEIKAVQPHKRPTWLDFILPQEIQNLFKGPGIKKTMIRSLVMLSIALIGVYFVSNFIYDKLTDKSSFQLALFILSLGLYIYVFYRFVRPKSILRSFEVAFYWMLLSIGLLIVFINTEIFFFDLSFSTLDNLSISVLNFISVFFILTIPLILNQKRKGISGPAVAIYYSIMVPSLWYTLAISMTLFYEFRGIDTIFDFSVLWVPALIVIIGSLFFWRYRIIRSIEIDRNEIAMYWLSLYIMFILGVNEVFNDENYLWMLNILFLILLLAIGTKWRWKSFFLRSSFSIFWIAIFLGTIFSSGKDSDAPNLVVVFVCAVLSVLLLYVKWRKDKNLGFESIIYWFILIFCTLFLTVGEKSYFNLGSIELGTAVTGLIAAIVFFVISKARKYIFHSIELFFAWAVFTILMGLYFSQEFNDYNDYLVLLFSLLLAIGFILWKIRMNTKFRSQYNIERRFS